MQLRVVCRRGEQPSAHGPVPHGRPGGVEDIALAAGPALDALGSVGLDHLLACSAQARTSPAPWLRVFSIADTTRGPGACAAAHFSSWPLPAGSVVTATAASSPPTWLTSDEAPRDRWGRFAGILS